MQVGKVRYVGGRAVILWSGLAAVDDVVDSTRGIDGWNGRGLLRAWG